MKKPQIALAVAILLAIVSIALERMYVSKLEAKFVVMEKERIIVSNKLATAKIVSENLHHVRDLVFENMDVQGKGYTQAREDKFFKFLTTCLNDLKLKLVAARPIKPRTQGRISTYGYDLEIIGDYFKFGELCGKFENSRRIISVENFDVSLSQAAEDAIRSSRKGIQVSMRINTYWIKK